MHIMTFPFFEKQLRTPGVTLSRDDTKTFEFKEKLDRLMELASEDGAGVAATQIGWPVRLFLIQVDKDLKRLTTPQIIINPTITEESKKKARAKEGCLSFPGLMISVERPETINWTWEDIDGNHYEASEQFSTKEVSGYYIRIIQHEIEHLSGKLFIDTISPAQQIVFKRWLNANQS